MDYAENSADTSPCRRLGAFLASTISSNGSTPAALTDCSDIKRVKLIEGDPMADTLAKDYKIPFAFKMSP